MKERVRTVLCSSQSPDPATRKRILVQLFESFEGRLNLTMKAVAIMGGLSRSRLYSICVANEILREGLWARMGPEGDGLAHLAQSSHFGAQLGAIMTCRSEQRTFDRRL